MGRGKTGRIQWQKEGVWSKENQYKITRNHSFVRIRHSFFGAQDERRHVAVCGRGDVTGHVRWRHGATVINTEDRWMSTVHTRREFELRRLFGQDRWSTRSLLRI